MDRRGLEGTYRLDTFSQEKINRLGLDLDRNAIPYNYQLWGFI
jgi:hypothetical protein